MNIDIEKKYQFVKQVVNDEGFKEEIEWQSNICFNEISESYFLRELAWVILSTGFKEQIIRNKFQQISRCFYYWKSAELIVNNDKKCFKNALKIFGNRKKISSIIESAKIINDTDFIKMKEKIMKNPVETLQFFPYIGKITVFHLAKNIGIDVAKPDRHLVKIASNEGFDDVQDFCKTLSDLSGDSVPVVDIVFWRFANLNNNYLEVLSSINFTN